MSHFLKKTAKNTEPLDKRREFLYNDKSIIFLEGGSFLDPLLGQLILQFILILVNAFFACSEIAVVSLNEKKMEKLAEEGDKKAAKVVGMLKSPEKFLSTIQVSITLAGFLGSAFAAENFAGRLTDWIYGGLGFTAIGFKTLNTLVVVGVTLILSYVTLVLGELVPKRIAMKKPDKVAKGVIGIISLSAKIARPVVWLLSVSTNGILRLLGIDPKEEDEEVTEEEIRLMVDAGEEDGNIEAGEKEMIENIFEFNNTTAADVMVHRTEMSAIDVEESFEEILKIIDETGFSRFPVYEGDTDNIIGVLGTRKFLMNLCTEQKQNLRDMIYEPYFVPESVRADVLFRDMQAKKAHIAVVLDEYGGTAGLITLEDLLEQIVGNIYDETDEEIEEINIEKLSDNLWRIQGTALLEAVEEELAINFTSEDDEYSTMSGLVFSRFTTIPADGETPELVIDRLHIQVEEITEHRVVSALVELLPEPDEADDKSDKDDD
ncbi:MAG: HlyC/CorC family transporter [Clostridia bacterium]|nr:HlyC/CorC family transporter [Clostridia bacterium]